MADKPENWKEWKNNFGLEGLWYYNPPADGNCQFNSIKEGLDPHYKFSANELRQIAAQQIYKMDDEWFSTVIGAYRDEVRDKVFTGAWLPLACRTKSDFAAAIERPIYTGRPFDFQGDERTLVLLSKALNVEFVTLQEEQGNGYTSTGRGEHPYTIFLIYKKFGKHYQVLGICGGPNAIQTIFYSDNLPYVLNEYFEYWKKRCQKKEREEKESKQLKELKDKIKLEEKTTHNPNFGPVLIKQKSKHRINTPSIDVKVRSSPR